MVAAQISSKVEVTRMPAFIPNDHLLGKAEESKKWLVFANAVRDVMAEASGLPKSDQTIEDKLAFINTAFPKKNKNKKTE